MTTVAFKDGVLAVDRCTSHGGLRYQTDQKLLRRGPWWYAITGDLAAGLCFVDWHEAGRPYWPCPLNEDVQVVAFNVETGEIGVWEAPGAFIRSVDKFEAWGSGSHLAIGAMAAGASAAEAVKIAAAWDEGTGFGVRTVKAKPRRAS